MNCRRPRGVLKWSLDQMSKSPSPEPRVRKSSSASEDRLVMLP